jgi:hypothetical protein
MTPANRHVAGGVCQEPNEAEFRVKAFGIILLAESIAK